MTDSKHIAKLVGPTISVMTTSELLNFHIWVTNIPPVTYLNGVLLFVGGLSIIRDHNYWAHGWPTLVTLVGWFGILGGLFRMFFPEAKQAGENVYSYAVIFFLLLVGIALTFKAYSVENSSH
jgi:arginine exporter protein ArgO